MQGPKIPPILKNSRFIINCNAKADDFLSFFSQQCKPLVNDSVLISAYDLYHDLGKINKWAYQWKMAFNPEPNKQAVEVLFSQNINSPNHPPIYLNGSTVSKVNVHKHLGLNLDSKLPFVSRIYEKINKAKKLLGILKYLYLSLKTLDQMYKIFIRPHFDYCDVIYHIPHLTNPFESSITFNALMERVEKIQYQAALAGTWQGTSRNKLYDELGWESLSDRRWCRRLIPFF